MTTFNDNTYYQLSILIQDFLDLFAIGFPFPFDPAEILFISVNYMTRGGHKGHFHTNLGNFDKLKHHSLTVNHIVAHTLSYIIK